MSIGQKYSKEIILPFCVHKEAVFGAVLYMVHSSTLELVIKAQIKRLPLNFKSKIQIGLPNGPQKAYWDMQMTMTSKTNFMLGTFRRSVIQGLELCSENINNWMNSNRLKMNNDKTEFICFRSR